MTKLFRLLLALVVSSLISGTAIGQTRSSPMAPADALVAGAEIFENLTERSPDLDAVAFDDAMATFWKLYPSLSAQLSPDGKTRLDALLAGVHKSWRARDRGAMAIGSIEIYRLLQESMGHDSLPVPAEVPMLDYAGFKIKALLISKHPDWEQVRKTAHEATLWWATIKPKVTDNALRDAMDHTIAGIHEAVHLNDPKFLAFAAEMDLILVDGLESFFNSHPQNH